MASLQERNGSYRVQFFFRGKLHGFTLGKVAKAEAEAKAAQVDYLLMRLKQKLVTLPTGVNVVAFVQHDGKPPIATPSAASAPSQAATLARLKDEYLATHANGTLEPDSLATCRIHLTHLCRVLGGGFELSELKLSELQGYVNSRSAVVAPVTVRKEITTLRSAWNWGVSMGFAAGVIPVKGLRYPKTDEKPPFMSLAEVRKQLTGGGDPDVLWECLYLAAPEVTELLAHVRKTAAHPWVYPLFCFAAHTGARRSELMRVLVADVDFDRNAVTIREKKRARGKRTSRRVPLTPQLRDALTAWLSAHPGGPSMFCHSGTIARSRKRSKTTGHKGQQTRPTSQKDRIAGVSDRAAQAPSALTRNEVHDHFRRVLKGSAWEGVRGLHVLRHSFISACASKGVDQRLIDEWVGHQTEDQRRRYRHLAPGVQQDAINGVFA